MFEGSEKKLEVIFSPDSPSLLNQDSSLWKKLIQSCGAEIISCKKYPKIHSFVLSESSLFVWPQRLVLITCGKTILSNALIKILKFFPKDSIDICFFQRKNEFFPKVQKSDFHSDLKNIQKKIDGKAYRFGPLHDHHFFLFHSHSDFMPQSEDKTLEILIYDSETIKNSSSETISYLKSELEKIFPGFEMQDHFFKPSGYSLNAVRDEFYYTIHITPEQSFFYISFETNVTDYPVQILTTRILNVFRPSQFDFIFFEAQGGPEKGLDFPDYSASSAFHKSLDCSYNITYKNFYKTKTRVQAPLVIEGK